VHVAATSIKKKKEKEKKKQMKVTAEQV